MSEPRPTVMVLGASGLIGQAVAEGLGRGGYSVVAVARRFSRAQAAIFGAAAVQTPLVSLDEDALGRLLDTHRVDIVVNCLGVLQNGPRGNTTAVHRDLVARLLRAMARRPRLLVHVSVPGRETEDATPFSRTKREGERLIRASGQPFVILRPGFVLAAAAYGGSALIRACAAMRIALPALVTDRPFTPVAVGDIVRTVEQVARRWQAGERRWAVTWDLVAREPATVGTVIQAMRRRGGGPPARLRLPAFALRLGAMAGDAAARLGWSPPVRSTALDEMFRGVGGDPGPWMAATGIVPQSLPAVLADLPNTVQERWFARLYLVKPLVLASLALFWIVSGAIALTVAFGAGAAIFASHGLPAPLAATVTAGTSLLDIGIGMAIAARKSCRAGLLTGIAVSLGYLASAALLAPELWLAPLGPLVKTEPAIVLMLVALLILDDR